MRSDTRMDVLKVDTSMQNSVCSQHMFCTARLEKLYIKNVLVSCTDNMHHQKHYCMDCELYPTWPYLLKHHDVVAAGILKMWVCNVQD